MPQTQDYSYPIFGDRSSIGLERRKTIEEQTGIAIKFAGKSRGNFNVKLIGTGANIAQARKLLDEAIERSRRYHESQKSQRSARREHFEAPMVKDPEEKPKGESKSNNPFELLVDGDGNAITQTHSTNSKFHLASPPKLSKKDRQARNKASKGAPLDVSQEVKGPISTLRKHNWEKKQALESKKMEAQIESQNSCWQLNPEFGKLSATVQLFDSQLNGTHIGQIYIGDSGMGYFGYHIGEGTDEHQRKLEMVDTHETYKGSHILTDKTKGGDLNQFQLDTEVTISVIVEENDTPGEPHAGNAWVVLSEEQLLERYANGFNWADEVDEE